MNFRLNDENDIRFLQAKTVSKKSNLKWKDVGVPLTRIE